MRVETWPAGPLWFRRLAVRLILACWPVMPRCLKAWAFLNDA